MNQRNISEFKSFKLKSFFLSFLSVYLFGGFYFYPSLAKSSKQEEQNSKTENAAINLTAPKKLVSLEELTQWMTYYYLHPQPELLVKAIKLAESKDIFQSSGQSALQAFSSRIFAQNPTKIKPWFEELASLKEENKPMILTAIWWSNCSEGKSLLDQIAQGLPEKARVEFHKQIDKAPPTIETMDIDSPDILDMLWACFSATGDEKYVKRVISVLPWSKTESKNLTKMMLASTAEWSIASNAQQHPRVLEICKSIEQSDKDLKPYLDKVFARIVASNPDAKEKSLVQVVQQTNKLEQKK